MWKEGKNVCLVATTDVHPGDELAFFFGAADTSLAFEKFIRKTASGRDPYFFILGYPGAAFKLNVFEMLSSLSEDGFFCLNTNIKIMKLDSLEHLKSCMDLYLFTNGAPIENEEVNCVDSIIAHVARDPRPMFPLEIKLPKVLNFS